MASERTQSGKEFLAELARGGFAESLTPHQRRQIHIQTDLDNFLEDALDEGKQVVLTGNPGDGKTQHILMRQDQYPDEDYYYLLDASEYADYSELLEEWSEAYNAGTPGVLAINDGPLYEMATSHGKEYDFLQTVRRQLENQTVYSDSEVDDIDFSDLVVVDLNNRDVLTHSLVTQAVRTFVNEFALEGHNHSGQCHIQYNAEKLQNDRIRENLEDFLTELGNYDVHTTVRDLLNFLCYTLTAGLKECQTDFGEELKYYNLAFEGSGAVFDLARKRFTSPDLVHPFVDSRLWAAAERDADFSDRDDATEVVEPLFTEKKRQFLFEDQQMDIGYESRNLFQNMEYDFLHHRNGMSIEGTKEQLIKMLNGYFRPNSSKRSELQLWLSHSYRSKSSLALVSRTTVPKSDFEIREPKLHPELADAIGYTNDHFALEYINNESSIRLKVNRSLYSALGALDADIPYTLRSRDIEQQILEFMEEIEYHETYSEEAGLISVKDTETGRVEEIDVNDDIYRQ
ncbi:hypothetical protein [Haloarcula nitratireducens]|uniref:Uncharacterized protein n=1 Tax=Haloarcula nitratireducens TaxID=2487749 RepID=A0AAW4PJP4_9EURY|nr:hypothetical protein [Halomicroarcula nitratireducens]MBX0297530.1 hypothetical protein [Halomicroarcula nitratireducens]